MAFRPICTYKDCSNKVMTGPELGVLLGVCQECFDKNRMLPSAQVEDDGEMTLYESSLGYEPFKD